MVKIAIVLTDNRQQEGKYQLESPLLPPSQEPLIEALAEIRDLEIHLISCTKKKMISPETLYGGKVFFHSLHVRQWGWGRTLFLGCLLAVRKKVKTLGVSLVHGQGTERDSALAAVFSGRKSIVTLHGNMHELHRLKLQGYGKVARLSGAVMAALETITLRRATGAFCNSIHTRHLVSSRAKKTWLVPNPIRHSFLEQPLPAKDSAPKRPIQFLCIGRIDRNKRQLEILRSVRRFAEQGYPVRISFIGSPGGDDVWRSELGRAVDAGWARELGFLDVPALIKCLDQADALLHFPVEEAFGLVVAEALSRNVRVFGSRIGGMVDICNDVPGGVLSDSLDAFEQEIRDWLANGAPVAEDSHQIMKERYAPCVIANLHRNLYQEILSA